MTIRCDRRRFLVGSGGVAVLGASGVAWDMTPAQAQAAQLPDYAAWKNAGALIIHTDRTMETRRDAVGSGGITPSENLFVRNNLPPIDMAAEDDPDAWEVSFEGVAKPGTMTLGEMKRLGVESVAAVLQCSGNGRGFFDHGAGGTQWMTGAAGNVLWTGVPVAAVVDALGGPSGVHTLMTSTGGETLPEGLDPTTVIVERSVPVDAMADALIAYEMNGAPIPIANGGPVRMIVPGYYGVNNVKYVKKIALGSEESPAKIQQTGYRMRPVGEGGAPTQASMWDMTVKSWVTHPLADAAGGRTQIYGVAFGGRRRATSVDVSLDGGESWEAARLIGPDMGPFAWRIFALDAELSPGTYRVASRATAEDGSVQPADFPPNERGYGHNGWRAHAVDVTVA